MSAPWLIRRASATDLQDLLAIEQASEQAPHWSPSQWLAALSDEAGKELMRATFVAEGEGGVAGFAVASRAADLAELESVVVSESERCKGIGKALCRQVMEWSRNIGASELVLEVRASNAVALTLYGSLGFIEQGRRREYYRHPTEDAVLMVARL